MAETASAVRFKLSSWEEIATVLNSLFIPLTWASSAIVITVVKLPLFQPCTEKGPLAIDLVCSGSFLSASAEELSQSGTWLKAQPRPPSPPSLCSLIPLNVATRFLSDPGFHDPINEIETLFIFRRPHDEASEVFLWLPVGFFCFSTLHQLQMTRLRSQQVESYETQCFVIFRYSCWVLSDVLVTGFTHGSLA